MTEAIWVSCNNMFYLLSHNVKGQQFEIVPTTQQQSIFPEPEIVIRGLHKTGNRVLLKTHLVLCGSSIINLPQSDRDDENATRKAFQQTLASQLLTLLPLNAQGKDQSEPQ